MDEADVDLVWRALESPSPKMIEAMEYDGVVPETIRFLVEERP
jgi:hypothetical protein